MAPFPLAKLGFLAVKQISKPLANGIKRKAKENPFVRKFICMPPAQFYHWLETNFRLRMMGLGGAKNVERLSEKEAIDLGGDMLGEFIVFGIAVLVLMAELQRQANKDKAKEEVSKREAQNLSIKLDELLTRSKLQGAQIRELQNRLDKLTLKPQTEELPVSENSGGSWFSRKKAS